MKAPEVTYDTFGFRFPYAQVFFGRSFPMVCEAMLQYSEAEDGNIRIKVTSLTGKGCDGNVYDLLYLTDDEDSMYAHFLIGCILRNKDYWNYEGDTEWWEQTKLSTKKT